MKVLFEKSYKKYRKGQIAEIEGKDLEWILSRKIAKVYYATKEERPTYENKHRTADV